MWERGYSKKKNRREGKTRVSQYNSQLSGYFTKADEGVEVVEQQVDRTHVVDKNIASSSPQILG